MRVQAFMVEAEASLSTSRGRSLAPRHLPQLSRDLDRFADSFTLAGLLSLVVGGVGVANAQGFVERKRATLAILKAIGAASWR